LAALLLLWAVLLFGGFILGRPDAEAVHRMPTWTRMASSAALAVAAWSWFGVACGGEAGIFALLVAIGVTLGLAGDLFMAKLLPAPNRVLFGLGAFGLGHVAYIAALLWLGDRAGLNAAGPRWGAWAAWLLVGLVGWYFAVYRGCCSGVQLPNSGGQQPTVLHWAALPYALLLASTVGFATGLAVQAPAFLPLAFGGALFLFSDLLLAAQLFNGVHFYLIGDVVWFLYGPAQMLIVYGVSAALRVLGR
jgi:hypothetical protein